MIIVVIDFTCMRILFIRDQTKVLMNMNICIRSVIIPTLIMVTMILNLTMPGSILLSLSPSISHMVMIHLKRVQKSPYLIWQGDGKHLMISKEYFYTIIKSQKKKIPFYSEKIVSVVVPVSKFKTINLPGIEYDHIAITTILGSFQMSPNDASHNCKYHEFLIFC